MTIYQTARTTVRRKAVWGPKRTAAALILILTGAAPNVLAAGANAGSAQSRHFRQAPIAEPGAPSSRVKPYKLDADVTRLKDSSPSRTSRVIVTLVPGAQLPPEFKRFSKGGLGLINAVVLDLPNGLIKQLESRPEIFRVNFDRPIAAHNFRTSVTVGATAVRNFMGYKGDGVGVAVIDSGIAAWHEDLTRGSVWQLFPYGDQRVAKFVDFVNGRALPYDDNGHGTHVAGIIGGNGYDSGGEKSGIAPNASLVSLKVLDANGAGTISSIIAALDWVATYGRTYNIRVVNMSVGARVRESYWTDPLTLACKRVTDLGITVVTAAGNLGKNAAGDLQYGGITAPGNAPWVLTVGASSTQGTLTRFDDVMAGFSSSGPTATDFLAKPDLVAPGTGTISLSAPGSTMYSTKAAYLLDGKISLGYKPYLTLSGTSMAAPVVSGTVALMLQANPTLTPNLIKAILQYTAQQYPGYSALRQGAGFLNTLGAVRLAKFYAENRAGARMPVQMVWSQQIIWGNHRLTGGYLNPKGNAWSTTTIWGAARGLAADDNIVWGTECGGGCDDIVWGTHDANGDNIVWGTADDDNIVWGTDCGGDDCDNVVWGTMDDDNIVWGTAEADDNIVWGTSIDDNIVWGTSAADETTWSSSGEDQVLFPEPESAEPLPDPTLEFGDEVVPAESDPSSGGGL